VHQEQGGEGRDSSRYVEGGGGAEEEGGIHAESCVGLARVLEAAAGESWMEEEE
jgi:hypothetical protein